MKATGVVRRLDELGRIVIPMEIRKTMRIRPGDPLELFIDKNMLIFQKYSVVDDMSAIVQGVLDALHHSCEFPVIACDKDRVIAANGITEKEIVNRRITSDMSDMMDQRRAYAYNVNEGILIYPVEGIKRHAIVSVPIIVSENVAGAIIFLSADNTPVQSASDTDINLIKAFATYLGEQLAV